MIIDKIKIIKLRDIENLEFSFGEKLTFIAGVNGTSKTSLLGLIGQPFDFRDNNRITYRTLIGTEFATKFSEIHNFTDYDDIESIQYAISLNESHNNKELFVQGYRRKGREASSGKARFVVGKTRAKGDGNYKLPVVYLGLKRLFPLGEHSEKQVKIKPIADLIDDDVRFFNEQHRKILLNLDTEFIPEKVETPNKKMLGGKTDKYDSHGLSAGQDNISQLLTAILSFKILKRALGDDYQGGLLLIDEIEATLHPVAQEKLIESLYSYASNLNLQIVVTTHSLEILKLGLQKEYKYHTEIIYLTKSRGNLEFKQKCSFEEIEADMTATPFKANLPKTTMICEDSEAMAFCRALLPRDLRGKLTILSAKLGGDHLKQIAESKAFQSLGNNKVIYLLDGDKKKHARSKNVLLLPGQLPPELLVWDLMNEMIAADPNWGKHTKQVYLKDYANRLTDRDTLKKFFKQIKSIENRSWSKFFKLWITENQQECNEFIEKLRAIIAKRS